MSRCRAPGSAGGTEATLEALRRGARWLAAAGLVAMAATPVADASVWRLEARTELALDALRSFRGTSPDDPLLLPRHRLVQLLGLSVFELVPGEELELDAALRLRADVAPAAGDAALVDGYRPSVVELRTLAVTWRNVGRRLDLKVGRQVVLDELDFLAFDGASASLRLPGRLRLDAFGGLVVKATSPLGMSAFAPDGVRDSDQRRLELGVDGADPQAEALEPLVGARIGWAHPRVGMVRAGWRRAMLVAQEASEPDPYGPARTRIDLERVSAAAETVRFAGARAFASTDWDLVRARLAQGRAGARYDAASLTAVLEASRFAPVFSADSIWAYFASGARDELRGRVEVTPRGWPLWPRLGAQVLRYRAELGQSYGEAIAATGAVLSTNEAHGLTAGASLAPALGRAALEATWRNGYGGRQLWIDLWGGRLFERASLSVDGRVSHVVLRDAVNPRLDGASTGVQLALGYRAAEGSRITAVLEDNFGHLTRNDLRASAFFDLSAGL